MNSFRSFEQAQSHAREATKLNIAARLAIWAAVLAIAAVLGYLALNGVPDWCTEGPICF